MQVRTSVSIDVDAPRDAVFSHATNAEVFPSYFKGAGPIPALTKIENTNGPETRAGTIRNLTSSDGAVMQEEMLEFDAPEHQLYKIVSGIKPPLSLIVKSGGGEWFFTETDSGSRIEWQFHFDLVNPLLYPFGALLVNIFFNKAMHICLNAIKEAAENEAHQEMPAAAAG